MLQNQNGKLIINNDEKAKIEKQNIERLFDGEEHNSDVTKDEELVISEDKGP